MKLDVDSSSDDDCSKAGAVKVCRHKTAQCTGLLVQSRKQRRRRKRKRKGNNGKPAAHSTDLGRSLIESDVQPYQWKESLVGISEAVENEVASTPQNPSPTMKKIRGEINSAGLCVPVASSLGEPPCSGLKTRPPFPMEQSSNHQSETVTTDKLVAPHAVLRAEHASGPERHDRNVPSCPSEAEMMLVSCDCRLESENCVSVCESLPSSPMPALACQSVVSDVHKPGRRKMSGSHGTRLRGGGEEERLRKAVRVYMECE